MERCVYVDLSSLREIGRGDEEFVRAVVRRFKESGEKLIPEAGERVKNQDWGRVAQIVHRLKGSALAIGAPQLAVVCEGIEDVLRNPTESLEVDSIDLESLHHTWEKTCAELAGAA